MEVILKKNVDKLGYTNEIVKVKSGYGRNFLIPRGYAILATASARKAHEEVMRQKAHKENKLADVTTTIVTKAGEKGKIFGSVNTIQLSDALKASGFEIDRKSLSIKNEPIKELGIYEAEANLYKGVKQLFKFEVVSE